MSLLSFLKEMHGKMERDLAGFTWFDLRERMEAETSPEHRVVAWTLTPAQVTAYNRRMRARERKWAPVGALAVMLIMGILGAKFDWPAPLMWALLLGLPLWIVIGGWMKAKKNWPDATAPGEVFLGKHMGTVFGKSAVWDYSEMRGHVQIKAASIEKGTFPYIEIKTQKHSARTEWDHDSPRSRDVQRITIQAGWALYIPFPPDKQGEAEAFVKDFLKRHDT